MLVFHTNHLHRTAVVVEIPTEEATSTSVETTTIGVTLPAVSVTITAANAACVSGAYDPHFGIARVLTFAQVVLHSGSNELV